MNNINSRNSDKIEDLKKRNRSNSENLKMMGKKQENILINLSTEIDNKDWKQCKSDLKELSNNSKEIHRLMEAQNSTTDEILVLLENSSKVNKVLCFSDWVGILIDQIIVPELGRDGWDSLSRAYTRNIIREANTPKFFKNEMQSFDQLKKILNNNNNITSEDFYSLIKLNRRRNTEFHMGTGSQNLNEAKQSLETTFPEDLECYREPLRKALDAIENLLKKQEQECD